jgi:hypothetical protein
MHVDTPYDKGVSGSMIYLVEEIIQAPVGKLDGPWEPS